MSLFGDLDIESAKDNPNAIPPNTYFCIVSSVKSGPTKDGSKVGVTFEYTIMDGDYKGKKFTEWKWVPQPADAKNPEPKEDEAVSYLKQRLISFGVPSDRMNTITPEEIIGVEVDVSVNENPRNPSYLQVRRVSLHDGEVNFR